MKSKIILLLLVLVSIIPVVTVFAATTSATNCKQPFTVGYKKIAVPINDRQVSVSTWYPSRAVETQTTYGLNRRLGTGQAALQAPLAVGCQPFPLLIFSHGYHGCALQSLYITEYLAQHGYVVVAPDHQDASCNSKNPLLSFLNLDLKQFRTPELWTNQTYSDRRDDIRGTLDEILRLSHTTSSFLNQKINSQAIGMLGHSLGGYIGLGLAGAWPSWKDPRVKALVALSPYAQPYLIHKEISNINIPVLLEGGTLDKTITPYFNQIYPLLQEPKEMVIIQDAGHLAWSNTLCRSYADSRSCLAGDKNAQTIVIRAATFFDRYLLNKPTANFDLQASSATDTTTMAVPTTSPKLKTVLWIIGIITLAIIIRRLWIS